MINYKIFNDNIIILIIIIKRVNFYEIEIKFIMYDYMIDKNGLYNNRHFEFFCYNYLFLSIIYSECLWLAFL